MNNPKGRQQWILDIIKVNPSISYVDMFAKYTQEFAKSSKTFDKDWIIASNEHKAYKEAINEARLNASITEEVEAVKRQIKTKNDRLLALQKQEDDLNKELEASIMIVHTFSDGEIVTGIRPMNSLEKASINKTIKEIRAEISKIEGDYAPIETKNKHEVIPPATIEL